MAYFVIEDFKLGLDTRRLQQATPAGALITLQNAHINRGAEVEKAKAFVDTYDIPAGTFGLAAVGGALYVFGSGNDPGVPAGITYQKLVHEGMGPPAMSGILSWDVFAGKLFVVAKYVGGDVRAFYDGTIVAGLLAGSGTAFAGLALGVGVRTLKGKMYACSGTNLLFSKINNAAIFDEAQTGSGLIDMTVNVSEEADIVGMQRYQNWLAVASKKNVSIWNVDADPAAYSVQQTLENLSFIAARTIRAFGDHDVFGLTNTGIRSLRAINASLAAGVDDVGTPIDDLILAQLDALDADTIANAIAAIEPRSGRYLMALGQNIYVFTYFAHSKISAWSIWNPGVNMTDFVTIANKLYARAGNVVYLQGGVNNDQYTANEVVVETPYLDARTISDWKEWMGIDLISTGVWKVYVNQNPNMPDYYVQTAVVDKHTIDLAKIGMTASAPMVKFKFVHQGAGAAVLSKIVVHYQKTGRSD